MIVADYKVTNRIYHVILVTKLATYLVITVLTTIMQIFWIAGLILILAFLQMWLVKEVILQ